MFKIRKKDENKTEVEQNLDKIYNSMINAEKIIENPEIIDGYPDRYWIIWDGSMGLTRVVDIRYLQKAINQFTRKGWRCVHITSLSQDAFVCYALMERPD